LIRAFKDARANYYLEGERGLTYYGAIRIPQALENNTLCRAVKSGKLDQDRLLRLEAKALSDVRGYDRDIVALEETVESVAEYGSLLAPDPSENSFSREKLRGSIRIATRRTLTDRPWSQCQCNVCKELSIEVVIFRSSNRNKRRGFHNLGVFYEHVRKLLKKDNQSDNVYLPRRTG
jgi:hypothetical protein